MTAGTLADPHFAPGTPWLVRRQWRRFMRDTFAPHENPLRRWLSAMSGFSELTAAKILGHAFAKTEYTKPTKAFLALGKEAAATTDTGVSIEASKEANYTSYARLELNPANLTVTTAAKSKISNATELTFINCTGGSSTIISFWVVEKKLGEVSNNVIMWGTVSPSVTITETQTPPTVLVGKLLGELQ